MHNNEAVETLAFGLRLRLPADLGVHPHEGTASSSANFRRSQYLWKANTARLATTPSVNVITMVLPIHGLLLLLIPIECICCGGFGGAPMSGGSLICRASRNESPDGSI